MSAAAFNVPVTGLIARPADSKKIEIII